MLVPIASIETLTVQDVTQRLFGVEFFREADSQLGYYFGNNITMGQILCFFMGLAGAVICLMAMKAKVVNKARLT